MVAQHPAAMGTSTSRSDRLSIASRWPAPPSWDWSSAPSGRTIVLRLRSWPSCCCLMRIGRFTCPMLPCEPGDRRCPGRLRGASFGVTTSTCPGPTTTRQMNQKYAPSMIAHGRMMASIRPTGLMPAPGKRGGLIARPPPLLADGFPRMTTGFGLKPVLNCSVAPIADWLHATHNFEPHRRQYRA